MAHSPLLRTMVRFALDTKSISLVKYELALEDISINLQLPPNTTNFDEARWSDLRKDYESKKTRDFKKKSREQELAETIIEDYNRIHTYQRTSQHYKTLFGEGEWNAPRNVPALKAAMNKTGLTEWRPPSSLESLLSENLPIPCTYGQVHAAEKGILDRRLLHQYLSPKYVPKPHFKMERRRLEAKSAEFAAFVKEQTSSRSRSSLIPRPEDESSDEGLLTMDESDDDTYYAKGSNGKRKSAAKSKTKKRTRKPKPFIKLFDCKAHDLSHLRSQAVTWYSLFVQRLPRTESPPPELLSRTTQKDKTEADTPSADINERITQELRTHGRILPVRFPRNDTAEVEEQPPTFEEAIEYRSWRINAMSFFNERDRYMQSRVYRESVRDSKLTHAVQDLMAFWARMTTW
ncbi:hypothetical protein F5Y11DRAFT_362669 [Daldinia sp. FL1419]|nr:hypothetical protein F5Y11DRAFT_362669 [Daldinia sp. FL1419]